MGKIAHKDAADMSTAHRVSETEWEADDIHEISGVASLEIVRTATKVVAANDSLASSKAMADYVCDNTADEVQIQTAVDALPSGGGRVVLLEGTYTLADTITLDDYHTLQGQGMRNTHLDSATANVDAINAGGEGNYGITVQDLGIKTSNSKYGINALGWNQCFFERLFLNASAQGIHLSGNDGAGMVGAYYNTIRGIYALSCVVGVKLTGVVGTGQANENWIYDSRFRTSDITDAIGLDIDIGAANTVINIYVYNGAAAGSSEKGIRIGTGSYDNLILHPYLENLYIGLQNDENRTVLLWPHYDGCTTDRAGSGANFYEMLEFSAGGATFPGNVDTPKFQLQYNDPVMIVKGVRTGHYGDASVPEGQVVIYILDDGAGTRQLVAKYKESDTVYTGNITLDGGTLASTNLLFKEEDSSSWAARNLADTAYRNIHAKLFDAEEGFRGAVDAAYLAALNINANYFAFKARDTDVGLVEVGRLVGAADPYFQATLPLRLLPIATASLPATPVEGMIAYDNTLNKIVVYNGSAWETVTSA